MKSWMVNVACLIMLVAMLAVPAWAEDSELDTGEPLTPFRYAYLRGALIPIYPAPGDPAQMVPVRHVLSLNTWVSIKNEV